MEKYKYKFSIVITVRNIESFLDEAVGSLLKQTIGFDKNVQLILVDETSTDQSGFICDNYAKKYPSNILVIHRENKEISSAYNRGISFIEGKYVNFLCGEDRLTADTLKEVFQFFENHYDETDMATVPVTYFGERQGEHVLNYKFQTGSRIIDLQQDYDCIQFFLSSAFIKQQDAKQIRFSQPIHFAEDPVECLKILMKKATLGVVAEGEYQYRVCDRERMSAIQESSTAKEWYIDYLDLFSQRALDHAKNIYGRVPKFIQFSVMHGLQWRFKTKVKTLKAVLSDCESVEFKNKLFSIVSAIDSEIILKQKNISADFKCFLLAKKYGEDPCYRLNDRKNDFEIYVNTSPVKNESRVRAEFSFLRMTGKDMIVEGVVYFLVKPDLAKTQIFLKANDDLVICRQYRVFVKDILCLDEIAMFAVGFTGVIPDFKQYPSLKIRVCTLHNGVQVERKKIKYGKFFPVAGTVRFAYAYRNGHVLSVAGNTVLCKRTGLKQHIKQEYLFLKELKHINTEESNNAILARCLFHFAGFFKKRKLWLLSDRINKADDNGEALFKYLNEKRIPENLYFVIRKDSPDYHSLKKYGNVLKHFSFKHKLYHLLADATISASGDAYVTNPYGKASVYYQDILTQQKRVFLQHGIIKDDLSGWLNRYNKNFDVFVTSAKPEYNSVLSYPYCYDKSVVKLTGLPRYDRLYDKKKKLITIMPTWREGLSDQTKLKDYSKDGLRRYNAAFKETEYFLFYNSLINNKLLLYESLKYGYTIQFMPHPNLICYIEWFTKNSNVQFCSIETKYRDIFAESALIITDYSSVAFDFAYLRKPVIYCQFDKKEIYKEHFYKQGYFDYERDGFGEVEYNLEDTINRIIEYMQNGCQLKKRFKRRIDNFFAFNDQNNCQRVYEAIKVLK